MNKIDLSTYETEDLKSLYMQIKNELKNRNIHKEKRAQGILRRRLRIHNLAPKSYTGEDKKITEIRILNSHLLASLPFKKKLTPQDREPYLYSLIMQDWKIIYPREEETGEYYVYAHVDPRLSVFVTTEEAGGNYGGRPFYIGKGLGNRAFDLKRNEGHGKTIKEILDTKYPPSSIVRILFSGLSEQKAFEIEAKLIYFFGIQFSVNEKGWLVNLTQPAMPEFDTIMKTMPSIEYLKDN